MIFAVESIAEFIKSEVSSKLTGITTPNLSAQVRAPNQPPEFENVLNLYFFDHRNVPDTRFNPHYRTLGMGLELLIATDPSKPLEAYAQALSASHKINEFMAVQSIQKKSYASGAGVDLGSIITWRDSYPLEWETSPDQDERYCHLTSFVNFRYFEEPVVA